VLGIDQAPKEKDGASALVGKTVTLELKPEQTATLAAARQAGTLSLALRSIADLNAVETDDQSLRRESINVIRYGIATAATTQK
jgi:pilus assembly protein CpaB